MVLEKRRAVGAERRGDAPPHGLGADERHRIEVDAEPVAEQREAAAALLTPGLVLIGDRNFSRFTSPTWRADLDAAGCTVVAPPPRRHAAEQDPAERTFLRHVRNRVETLIGLLKSEHGLEDHGAHSWWGLRTRVAGVLAAYTIGRYLMTVC